MERPVNRPPGPSPGSLCGETGAAITAPREAAPRAAGPWTVSSPAPPPETPPVAARPGEADPAAVLPIRVLRFSFEGADPVPPATIWRSAFGPSLREAVCVARMSVCEPCLFLMRCLWPRFFMPGVTPGRGDPPFGVSPEVPPPYALAVQGGPRGPVLELRLFGGASVGHASLLADRLLLAGARGLGRARIAFVPDCVEALDGTSGWSPWTPGRPPGAGPPPPPPPPSGVEVHIVGALRLERDHRLLAPEEFRARDFALAVLRRLALLAWAHGEGGLPPVPFEAAGDLVLSGADLRARWDRRYSARQGRSHPLGGLGGRFRLAGKGLAALWPWLWLGQWTGVGKACAQGLGVYRLAAPARAGGDAP